MSSILKVTLEQESNGRHVLLFNNDINDHYITPGEGEGEFDFPIVSETMHWVFEESRIASNIKVSIRQIEFTIPRGGFLDEVVAGLLELLASSISTRTFLVYMSR